MREEHLLPRRASGKLDFRVRSKGPKDIVGSDDDVLGFPKGAAEKFQLGEPWMGLKMWKMVCDLELGLSCAVILGPRT